MTAAALRHRTDGAISRGNDGSFGPRLRCVLGDVGVRFGGSEHHRIETSSSHTRPPPYGAGLPATGTGQAALFGALRATFHRGTATGALRSTARTTSSGQGTRRSSEHQAPHSTGQGTRRSSEHQAPHPTRQGTGPLRRRGPPPHPARAHGLVSKEPRPSGHGERRSSEHRPHGLVGVRQPALFGAPRARLHRDREPGALRSLGPPTPTGTGQTALFGAPRAPPRREKADGALRSTASPNPPGQGTGPLRRAGTPPQRNREPDLFGGSAPNPTGPGPRYGMDTPPTGQAHGALRGTASCASPGPGNRSSSEPRASGLVGTGTSSSSEPGRPEPTGTGTRTSSEGRHPRLGSGRDLQPRPGRRRSSERRPPGPGTGTPDLFGGSDPPFHGPPATQPLGAGPPATRG
jgi:hypothetical protein